MTFLWGKPIKQMRFPTKSEKLHMVRNIDQPPYGAVDHRRDHKCPLWFVELKPRRNQIGLSWAPVMCHLISRRMPRVPALFCAFGWCHAHIHAEFVGTHKMVGFPFGFPLKSSPKGYHQKTGKSISMRRSHCRGILILLLGCLWGPLPRSSWKLESAGPNTLAAIRNERADASDGKTEHWLLASFGTQQTECFSNLRQEHYPMPWTPWGGFCLGQVQKKR